jgi:predicted ATPase/DNA-binding SARP family transcriptional activator
MAERLELELLGAPMVRRGGMLLTGFRSSKAQALLYYVAVAARPHARTELAELFWGDWELGQALVNLTKTLSNLRQVLGEHLLISRETVEFNRARTHRLDVDVLNRALDLPVDQADSTLLEEAIASYRGDFLDGFYVHDAPEFETWALSERAQLREGYLQLLETLADRHMSGGHFEAAAGLMRRVLVVEPWHEEAHRQLMALLAQAGQRGAALAQYELCRQALAAELAVEPSLETETLYQRIRRGELAPAAPSQEAVVVAPPAPQPMGIPHNLPVQPTPFVGRQKEVEELASRLAAPECRLLTLAGPGGIGKTRLALRVAQRLATASPSDSPFSDGIFFVSLATMTTAAEMVSAIAGVLGFQFYAEQAPDRQLVEHLQTKRLLLVLDNCEQLVPEAPWLSELLAEALDVTLLATSREALKLREEWFYAVRGLDLPKDATPLSAGGAEFDAIQLFVHHARRAHPAFALEGEQAHVLRICRLVEGMPLAIELAAAWLKALPAGRVADELERTIDILTAPHQNIPIRHRSIRAVMDQTWEMLERAEQRVLMALSVFQDGFQMDAAEAVAGASLLHLAGLAEKALIRVMPGERYGIHELLRQMAAEKLAAGQEETLIRRRHADYFLRFVTQRAAQLQGRVQPAVVAELTQEVENVRAAWRFAVAVGNWTAVAEALTGVYHYIQISSRYLEGRELFAGAVEQLSRVSPPVDQGRLLRRLQTRQAALGYALGAYEETYYQLQLCVTDADNERDDPEQAFVLRELGRTAASMGREAEAERYLRQSLAIAGRSGDRAAEADSMGTLAGLYNDYGDFKQGRRLGEASLAICRELDLAHLAVGVLIGLGWSANCVGEYDRAKAYWEESMALGVAQGDEHGAIQARNFLGWDAYCRGGAHLAEAVPHYLAALAVYRRSGHRRNLAMCLGDLAMVSGELGDYASAVRYGEEGWQLAASIGHFDLGPYNLYALAWAAAEANELSDARRYLQMALRRLIEHPVIDHQANVMVVGAKLLAAEEDGAASPTGLEQSALALGLLAVGLAYPAIWQPIKDRGRALQQQLLERLAPDQVAAAEEWAAAASLDLALQTLEAELARVTMPNSASR